MKNVLSLLLFFVCGSLLAINPTTNSELADKFNSGSENIDTELRDLQNMNNLVIENDYDFNGLNANHAEMVTESKLSSSATAGILEGHPDNPIGIPGFWWGFCGGLLGGWFLVFGGLITGLGGVLIVYLTMDEGTARKEQVKNAVIGCLIGTSLWAMFFLVASVIGSS